MEVRVGYKQTEIGLIPSDWGVVTLGSLATVVASGRSSAGGENGNYPVHGSTGVIGYCDLPEYEGSAILAARVGANAGRLNLVSGKYGVTDNTILLRLRDSCSLPFFWRQLEAKKLNRMVFGSGQPLITGSQLKALVVGVPSFNEQHTIAATLADLDSLLAGLERLIAKKRDLKQAAMQQLLTGQTRLPGFQGEWDMRPLADAGRCLRGVSYNGDADLSTHDTASTRRLLRSNNVQGALVVTNDVQYVNMARVSPQQVLTKGDILICMANGSKALVGKAGRFDIEDGHEYTFGAFMGCFRTNELDADSAFVFYLFQTGRYRGFVNDMLAGSSINNLKPSSIESLEFSFPDSKEQTAIATVLSDMDTELSALEARRDKTRALKQGMMQELLTGRTRLV